VPRPYAKSLLIVLVAWFGIWPQSAQAICFEPQESKPAEFESQEKPAPAKHVKIYGEPGRFGGWPANHGIWIWGNEILVGFSIGFYKDLGPDRHAIDREKPEHHVLARSLDGGETWALEFPAKQGVLIGTAKMRHGTLPADVVEADPIDCPGGIEFTHPNFAMTCRMAETNKGVSRFYYSYDRGKTWKGPFKLPLFGQPGIAARTDYVIDGPRSCLVFLTAAKKNEKEGRVICGATSDGGKTWGLHGLIGPEPEGYAIMPSTVRLSPTSLLTTIRRLDPKRPSWIESWKSMDDGKTWLPTNERIAETGEGNPPALLKLADGRLCVTYGVRSAPFRMAAKFSSDGGTTWSEEVILRADGANRDLGYPRSVQRPDGKVVTIYYFSDTKSGPERYVAATIWEPRGQAQSVGR
jgi:BNR repeat-like domain